MEPAKDFQLLADVGVGLHAAPRGWRDLCENNLAAIARVAFQKLSEGLEFLRQPFGVVQAIDADNAVCGGAPCLHEPAVPLGMGEVGNVDADREAANRDQPIEQADAAIGHDAAKHAIFQISHQIGDIGLGLQTNEVVGGQGTRELLMLRDRHKGLPGRKRNVQEEPNRVLRPQPPQLRCERQQVVVVHPDEVVAAQQRLQLFGEPPVDADIALKEARLELRQVQAIVKDRPQHRIAIAEVVGLMVGFRERNGGHAPLALHRRRWYGRA